MSTPDYLSSPCKNYYEYSEILKQFAQNQEAELKELRKRK